MITNQTTIRNKISVEGTGLHTGSKVTLTFKPSAADTGFVFKRTDIEGQPEIPALANYVVSTDRGTTIGKNQVVINTVEHVLAALVGLSIDNCLMEIDGPETPIMDGSSKFFVEALEKVGIEELDAERHYFEIKEPLRLELKDEGVELMAVPAEEYQLSVMVDYGTKVLGSQNATLNHISDFKKEVADSRTFSFLHELELLLEHGLIKGGDLNNAIVYVDKEVSPETLESLKKAFKKDNVSVKTNGILDNLDLHYPNEAARHKLLDVVGDLALAGKPIKGRIFATKPGHKGNTQFARLILDKIREEEKKPNIPTYDPNAKPHYDTMEIMQRLPHRPPFLLVDKIIELTEDCVVGVKNVTMNEAFFQGHFPGAPVMPGVLQVEAMAQVGGILALSTVPDPENYLTYFLKMDNVKFKQKVLPGDTLVFKLVLSEPIRRGIVQMHGEAYVGNKLVSEASLMAQIVKERN
ncbi:MAG: bifunctional UDP-3-O-[3-hydroxymyristoyl] N-acetylglucosamine deacetylase/3-hydroxyacyl-ACP dehydratase [Owenweeksia sp.]